LINVSYIDQLSRTRKGLVAPSLSEEAVTGGREIGNAPAYGGSMMSSIQRNPLHSCAEIGILPCSKCGNSANLASSAISEKLKSTVHC
jgi:hypothetical protein